MVTIGVTAQLSLLQTMTQIHKQKFSTWIKLENINSNLEKMKDNRGREKKKPRVTMNWNVLILILTSQLVQKAI